MSTTFFNVISSNDISVLAEICARIIRVDPLVNPFDREQILIMNNGITNYLEQEIAKHNGIHVQCDYYDIWKLIWEVYKKVTKNDNSRNLYSRQQLTWNILGLKERWMDEEKEPLLEKLRQYVKKDLDGRMAFDLSNEISDTFDQYQMYRPQWITAWQKFTDQDFNDYQENVANNKIEKWILKIAKKDKKLEEILRANVWQIRIWSLLKTNFSYKTDDYAHDAPEALRKILAKSRSEVIEDLISLLRKKDKLNINLPKRIFIFGVSSVAPQVFNFLDALSKHVQVYFLFLNPCQEYWCDLKNKTNSNFKDNIKEYYADKLSSILSIDELDDTLNIDGKGKESLFNKYKTHKFLDHDKSKTLKATSYDEDGVLLDGNSLLLTLGKQGSDNLYMLLNDLENTPNFIDAFVDIEDYRNALDEESYISDDSDSQSSIDKHKVNVKEKFTLLHFIKRQMLTLNRLEDSKYEIDDNDKSIVIHSCHTKKREVEVLRDCILQKFKEAKAQGYELLPRDIIVMVPTINEYAPYISAVFGSIDRNDETYIPYAITDKTVVSTNPVAEAILTLLSISEFKITNNLIIDLLSIPAIASHFNFEASDIDVISNWLKKCNILWGLDYLDCKKEILLESNSIDIDSEDKELYDMPFTFSRGINRMIEGYMLGTNESTTSYNEIEGSDSIILGNFCNFIQKLSKVRKTFTPELRIDANKWESKLEELIIEPFFDENEDTMDARDLINTVIRELSVQTQELAISPPITLLLFKTALSHSLSSKRDHRDFLNDNVNFCSLVPMRAVPFEHIFILGLNDTSFPRKDTTPAFNLMSENALYQRGDRSRVNDDKYLFLEAILSAKESINLFYIGESPIDKKEQNPSSVLIELINYIVANCEVKRATNKDTAIQNSNKIMVSGQKDIANTLYSLFYSDYKDKAQSESGRLDFYNTFEKYAFSIDSINNIKDRLIIKETLSAFDKRNYYNNSEHPMHILSYNKSNFVSLENDDVNAQFLGINDIQWPNKILDEKEIVIDFNELYFKLRNLNKVFLNNVLEISLDEYSNNILDEDENFLLKDYQISKFINTLVSKYNERLDILNESLGLEQNKKRLDKDKLSKNTPMLTLDEVIQISEERGDLPYGIFGQQARDAIKIRFNELKTGLNTLCEQEGFSLSLADVFKERAIDKDLVFDIQLPNSDHTFKVRLEGRVNQEPIYIELYKSLGKKNLQNDGINIFLLQIFLRLYVMYILNDKHTTALTVIGADNGLLKMSITNDIVSVEKDEKKSNKKNNTEDEIEDICINAHVLMKKILSLYVYVLLKPLPFNLQMLKRKTTSTEDQNKENEEFLDHMDEVFLFGSLDNIKSSDYLESIYDYYLNDSVLKNYLNKF